MPDSTTVQTKVAVLATSADQSQQLQTILEKCGLEVVLSENQGKQFLSKLKKSLADVLFINLSDDDDDGFDVIDSITEKSTLPMLFNDSGTDGSNLASYSDEWASKVAIKLNVLVNNNNKQMAETVIQDPFPLAKSNGTFAPSPTHKPTPTAKDDKKKSGKGTAKNAVTTSELIDMSASQLKKYKKTSHNTANLNIWVLGASLGGPQAVRQFLATISEDLPVAFILAQHIGANHVALLAEQLNKVTKFKVIPGKTGHKLSHQEVILTPADKQLAFTDDGFIALRPAETGAIYSPSIDNVMSEVATHFGDKAGTIVFSGMGNDGAKGCKKIAKQGGMVWAQDVASCVISSMPDQARKTNTVSYSATPEELANHLHDYYFNSSRAAK
jgi:chemosensory pili system protein ChpB (putative protein-glutamate methylesterase)